MPEDENPFSNIISDDEDAETEEVLEGEEERLVFSLQLYHSNGP